jgi:tagatose 1,6-diphosphate aldolase
MKSKRDKLRSLADQRGRFKILALDHVNGLRKSLAAIGGISDVPNEHIFKIKELIIKEFVKDLSGILIDRDAFAALKTLIPEKMGVLIKLDDGWTEGEGGSRVTKVFAKEGVQIAASQGVSGVKLMLYYRHDASREARRSQENLVRLIGEQCRKQDMLFCLEPWWYPLHEDERENTARSENILAERRPDLVIKPLEVFSRPEYEIDLFKLDFPADLRYVKELSAREPMYDLAAVRDFCSRIESLVKVPWTVMSSGVIAEQFEKYLTIGKSGALAGYVCGQALWGDAMQQYPDFRQIEKSLREISLPRLRKINETMDAST